MTRTNPIPDHYRRITPSLVVADSVRAIDFYTEVFGAIERIRFPDPDGGTLHAELEVGDSVLILEDESSVRGTKAPPPGGLDGSPAFLVLHVADVDATIDRAVELGANVVRPATDQFYGDRDGYLIDPFGHGWTIATHVEDVSAAEMTRRMALMSERT